MDAPVTDNNISGQCAVPLVDAPVTDNNVNGQCTVPVTANTVSGQNAVPSDITNDDDFVDITPLKQQIPVEYEKVNYDDNEMETLLEHNGVSVYQIQPNENSGSIVLMEVGRFLQPIEVLISEFDFKELFNCNMVLVTYTVDKLRLSDRCFPLIKIIVSNKKTGSTKCHTQGSTTDEPKEKLFPIGCIMLNFNTTTHKENSNKDIEHYLSSLSSDPKELHGHYSITFHYTDNVTGCPKYVTIDTMDTYLGQHEMFEKVIGCLHDEFVVETLRELNRKV